MRKNYAVIECTMCGHRKKVPTKTNEPCSTALFCKKCGAYYWRTIYEIGENGECIMKQITFDAVYETIHCENIHDFNWSGTVTKTSKMNAYIRDVNKTCRSNGCVGKNAVVPKIVKELATPEDRILDFGAGTKAVHAMRLRKENHLNVTAHDIGDNFNPEVHDKGALSRTYSMIYCSNVMNVQPSRNYVNDICKAVYDMLEPEGLFVVNYPKEPRKCPDMSEEEFERYLSDYFQCVKCDTTSPAWVCKKKVLK
jgi:hypothetical protein